MPRSLSSTIAAAAILAAALCRTASGQGTPGAQPQGPGAQPQSNDAQAREDQAHEIKGVPPRATPGDYQAQAKAGAVTIAAEFTAHAVSTPEAILSTEDYVVVEVALFGPADVPLKFSSADFSLRVNGRKMPAPAEAYSRIFQSLKDPEWEPPESESKAGKTSVGTGGKDLNAPPPSPPKMPFELRRAMQLRVQRASLPAAERALPVAGLIFFPYHGKAESIQSVELLYDGAAGKAVLTLHP